MQYSRVPSALTGQANEAATAAPAAVLFKNARRSRDFVNSRTFTSCELQGCYSIAAMQSMISGCTRDLRPAGSADITPIARIPGLVKAGAMADNRVEMATSRSRTDSAFWLLGGLATAVLIVAFVLIARGWGDPGIRNYIYLSAGMFYMMSAAASRSLLVSRRALLVMILLAVLMRAAMWFTPESPGGDYYRYYWDGALTAHGKNPYAHSPGAALRGEVDDATIQDLALEGERVLRRVSHPELRTIYPPVSQLLFAGAYVLTPFQSEGWRIVLLVLDAATALMLFLLLRAALLPIAWLSVYLWNPLLLVETYHYRHVDLALAPFLLLFLWALWRLRPKAAGLGLALAVGVKLWPAILLPLLLGRFEGRERKLAGGVFLLAAAVLLAPYITSLGGVTDSGTVAYARIWDAHSLAYDALHRLGWGISRMLGGIIDGRLIARAFLMVLLLALAVHLGRRSRSVGLAALSRHMTAVIVLMLLLTPTLYPWYFVPAAAIGALTSQIAFLVWTPLLVLTYTRTVSPYPFAILLLIHVPVWIAFVRLLLHNRKEPDDRV
jgi:alpha-1,6-mannosyltransferase